VGGKRRRHRTGARRAAGKLNSGGRDLKPVEKKALQYKTLHEHGYTFTEKRTIGSLTQRQIKLLTLGDLVEQDLKQRSREQQRNPQSQSHEHYDPTDSRREAFSEFQ
jgi:hypothetical protein